MFSNRQIGVVLVMILAQFACSLGGYTISPSKDNQTTSSDSSTPEGVIAVPSQVLDVIPPTPALNIQIPPPEAGTGSVAGRILWNGQPVVGTEVKLCEKMGMFTGCEGTQFSSFTDDKGIYLLANITPGEYALVFHAIDKNAWIYVTSNVIDSKKLRIDVGKTQVLEDQHLYKMDMKILTPSKQARLADPQPAMSWEPYAGAAYYKVSLRPDGPYKTVLYDDHFISTSITPAQPLIACDYLLKLEAFNEQGVKIAEYDGFWDFTIIEQPITCYVKVLSPSDKTQVSAAGVELIWEEHPLAAYYQLSVRKGSVGGEAIVDYARVDSTSYKFTEPLTPGEYVWSVGAFNSSGDRIAGSSLYYFTVK